MDLICQMTDNWTLTIIYLCYIIGPLLFNLVHIFNIWNDDMYKVDLPWNSAQNLSALECLPCSQWDADQKHFWLLFSVGERLFRYHMRVNSDLSSHCTNSYFNITLKPMTRVIYVSNLFWFGVSLMSTTLMCFSWPGLLHMMQMSIWLFLATLSQNKTERKKIWPLSNPLLSIQTTTVNMDYS